MDIAAETKLAQQLHEIVLISTSPGWRINAVDAVPRQLVQLVAWHASGMSVTVDIPWDQIGMQFGHEFREQVSKIRQQQHEASQKFAILFEAWLRARIAQNREPGAQDNGN